MSDDFALSEKALHQLKGWELDIADSVDVEIEGLEELWEKIDQILGESQSNEISSDESTSDSSQKQ